MKHYTLSVYSDAACQQKNISLEDGARTKLAFAAGSLGLAEDLELVLACREEQLFFEDYKGACFSKENVPLGSTPVSTPDFVSVRTAEGERVLVLVQDEPETYTPFWKLDMGRLQWVIIGRGRDADICVDNRGMISKEHVRIQRDAQGALLVDASTNGTYVNGRRVSGTCRLAFGDRIHFMGFTVVWLGSCLAVDTSSLKVTLQNSGLSAVGTGRQDIRYTMPESTVGRRMVPTIFKPVPRAIDQLASEPIVIEQPPQQMREDKRSVLATLGPSMTMAIPMMLGSGFAILGASRAGMSGSMFMYTGLITAVSSATIGTVWAAVNMRNAGKKSRQEEENRVEAYRDYLQERQNEVEKQYKINGDTLQRMYPSAGVCSRYTDKSIELWSHNSRQKDFLYLRLGLGTMPFQTEIRVQEPRFQVYKDRLTDEPGRIRQQYRYLQNVPVGISLAEHLFTGIIGGKGKTGALQVAQAMITQIAANYSYTDVKICIVCNGENEEERAYLEEAKWLPHVWSEDRKTRYVADNAADAAEIFYELAGIFRKRAEAENTFGEKTNPRPYYLFFCTDLAMLSGELVAKYVLDPKEVYGVSTILIASGYEELPGTCEYVIENDASFQGIYPVVDDGAGYRHITYDRIGNREFSEFAKRLSMIRVNETESSGEIPGTVSFFDLYGVRRPEELQIADRWQKSRVYETMRAPIGVLGGDALCYLDVHERYHGPHGLIAGTTGSGKSETLQTYILSLAVNYSPDDVGFFIIDYKGGGMANLFSGLPHMMGQISNLSGNQVRRAMISIKSENKRRQRIFNENGVNSINQYTQLYKNQETQEAIPHLFIIIDEFAELKREEPEFMQELISVAQVGRSLGVHLILSTQKPAGTVDDNIWSNAKFRMCLRVQDKQDSMDMLHKPDAAWLTQTGRCYLQVGNDEIYELFQSGWSGETYDDEEAGTETEIVRMITMTGKTAMTGSRLKIQRQEEKKRKWIGLLMDAVREVYSGYSSDENGLMTDGRAGEQICGEVILSLQARGVDYPENEYNIRRIAEFISLYDRVCTLPEEQQTSELLKLAVESGSKLPEQKKRTQLEAVTAHIEDVARKHGYDSHTTLWMPPLPSILYLEQVFGAAALFDGTAWKNWTPGQLCVPVGMCDDPVNQAQFPLEIDLTENGHLAVIGSVSSGKSTFLQSFVAACTEKYSPAYLHMYLLDFSSHMLEAFEKAPHVGGIMNETTPDRIQKFFYMMQGILAERKQVLSGGTYQHYVRANGPVLPAICVVIDQYAGFREKTQDRYAEFLQQLAREGAGYGIYLVLSAGGFGGQEIERRVSEQFGNIVCLEMQDQFAYADVLHVMRPDVLPEPGVTGRGLVKKNEVVLEFQTALALNADNDYERSEKLQDVCESMLRAWPSGAARPIPEIPENPTFAVFREHPGQAALLADPYSLPVGYAEEDASLFALDLRRIYCYLISGRHKSGKTNFLKLLLAAASEKGAVCYVIDRQRRMQKAAKAFGATLITEPAQLFEAMKDLLGKFGERKAVRDAALSEGLNDAEVFERMTQFTPVIFLIDNVTDYIDMVENPGEDVPDMRSFVENITEKGAQHQVYFFAAFDPRNNSVGGSKIFEAMARDRMGIHLGGDVASQRLFTFDYIPFSQQSKKEKAGVGLIPSEAEMAEYRRVITPVME